MCLTRGQVTAAYICGYVEPHGSDWNRFPAHSARAITLAHRALLINTTPVRATVDTTRSHAGAPVRDGLRLINA